MSEVKVLKLQDQSGRRAETHVKETSLDGATERVTEHFEEKIDMELKKRVTEKVEPIVTQRVVEVLSSTGEVTQREIEAVSANELEMKKVEENKLAETIATAIKAALSEQKVESLGKPKTMQSMVRERVKAATETPKNSNSFLWMVFSALVAYLVWMLLLKDLMS